MAKCIAKRIKFKNGERHSVLCRANGQPIPEVTLYLAVYRRRGRSANTIHLVCSTLSILYQFFNERRIDLLSMLTGGGFLGVSDVMRLADRCQYWKSDVVDESSSSSFKGSVVNINKIRMKRGVKRLEERSVDVLSQATRIRCIADYLEFISYYCLDEVPKEKRNLYLQNRDRVLRVFRNCIPKVRNGDRLGARRGLAEEEQAWLLEIIHPDSDRNPWCHEFAKIRNRLIVLLLLATGMRRGELLGLKVEDLNANSPLIRVLRRADDEVDPRRHQPNTKTNARELEIRPAIMKLIWEYVNHYRYGLLRARKHPYIFVSEAGQPLSLKAIEKMFFQLHRQCGDFEGRLTSHVMRHTWNERFSKYADRLNLNPTMEERARNEQQGWVENSKSAAYYTRRHTTEKGRKVALGLQETLDESIAIKG